VPGTQQAQRAALDAAATLRCRRRRASLPPRNGTIVALDPDIPPAAPAPDLHRTTAAMCAGSSTAGKLPAGPQAQVAWLPWPGRHELRLADAGGAVLDEIRVEVRGAGVKARP
jgi:penicillin-binding protein 1C